MNINPLSTSGIYATYTNETHSKKRGLERPISLKFPRRAVQESNLSFNPVGLVANIRAKLYSSPSPAFETSTPVVVKTHRSAKKVLQAPPTTLPINIKWTPEEDQSLKRAIEMCGYKWTKVEMHVKGKTGEQCRSRKNNLIHSGSKDFLELEDMFNPQAKLYRGKPVAKSDKYQRRTPALRKAAQKLETLPKISTLSNEKLSQSLQTYNPISVGSHWKPDEDLLLAQSIIECGYKWSDVANKFSERTPDTCRKRKEYLIKKQSPPFIQIDKLYKKKRCVWKEAEILQLKNIFEKHGYFPDDVVKEKQERRTVHQCSRKWNHLKHLETFQSPQNEPLDRIEENIEQDFTPQEQPFIPIPDQIKLNFTQISASPPPMTFSEPSSQTHSLPQMEFNHKVSLFQEPTPFQLEDCDCELSILGEPMSPPEPLSPQESHDKSLLDI